MRRIGISLPSPAGVISVIALFVALGGTGYAASRVISPSAKAAAKRVTKGYVKKTAKRIADAEIASKAAGLTVRLATFATAAGTANSATAAASAANATHANNADSASVAGNASNLGGQPPSAFYSSGNVASTASVEKFNASVTGQFPVTLGPFTVSVDCTASGANRTVTVNAKSSEANSILDGTKQPTANTNVLIDSNGPGTSFAHTTGGRIGLLAPSGAAVQVSYDDGIFGFSGFDCYFSAVMFKT
jgi:hypothetical protein